MLFLKPEVHVEGIGESRVRVAGRSLYSYVDATVQRIGEYAATFFALFDAAPELVDVEKNPEDNKELRAVNDDRRTADGFYWDLDQELRRGCMNLSSRQSIMVSGMDGNEPHYYVKLPRRQIHLFPEAMRRKLLNIEDDQLNIFFAIYLLGDGKKDFSLSIPDLKRRCSVGFYGGTGVARGPGRTVPWHFIREYSQQEASEGLNARLTEDVGAFKMGAFAQNCKGPNRGMGVYGLVLSDEGRGLAIREILETSRTIREFVGRINSPELTEIFTFNDKY